MLRHLARQAFASFIAWRARRRLTRSTPELAEIERLRREVAKLTRQHRPTATLRDQLKAAVRERLAREQGVSLTVRKQS